MTKKLFILSLALSGAPALAAGPSAVVKHVCKTQFSSMVENCQAKLAENQTVFLSAAAIEACVGAGADPGKQLECVAGTANKNYPLKKIASCRESGDVAGCLSQSGKVVGAQGSESVVSRAAPVASPESDSAPSSSNPEVAALPVEEPKAEAPVAAAKADPAKVDKSAAAPVPASVPAPAAAPTAAAASGKSLDSELDALETSTK